MEGNMNTWGNTLRLSIFGESHGSAVGIVVDGLPPGEAIDLGLVEQEMARRAPGGNEYSTARRETDRVEILSGLLNGKTTGAPICGLIRGEDVRSRDYDTKLRPGHADWTALLKYGGHADMRGGGHFSGRLTAPLLFAGALAGQVLARRQIAVFARITAIGGVTEGETPRTPESCREIARAAFPAESGAAAGLRDAILTETKEHDSVGGIVEAVAFGLPGGLGDPFFGSLESRIASLLFSVPAVKGVEFGEGFHFAHLRGSAANDELYAENGEIFSYTNHNGGILGGISNGAPLVVRAAFKPTPSIARPQRTVDAAVLQNTEILTRGRHDPCVVPRATPVVEACVALSVLDCLRPDAASWRAP
jgi:chorismate synthase